MLVSEFDYHLPKGLIAQSPAERRDGSRLLVLDRLSGAISHTVFSRLPSFLDAGDLVVINDTKVIPARLLARKATGGRAEILLVRRLPGDGSEWLCMAQTTKRIRTGLEAVFPGGERCVFRSRLGDGHYAVRFDSAIESESVIKKYGETPLPPYIAREGGPHPDDSDRYQTVYASNPGSCAAPTAGLHFTSRLISALGEKTAGVAKITLHVGPGTFLPVRAERVEDHVMHGEWCEIGEDAARAVSAAKRSGMRVTAVGTTVVRMLEHAALSSGDATSGEVPPTSGITSIFITPGWKFRVIDRLLTNFHLPRSTLLMLVCAFAGTERVLRAYREAVKEKYRFYSFGDAMLIL